MQRLRQPLVDSVFLTILILVLSWLIRSTDPGWFKSQFSPWLLIPVLVGGRHGFMGGVMAAVIAGLVATIMQQFLTSTEARYLLTDNPAYYVGLLLVGALSGLTHRMKIDRLMGIEEEVEQLRLEKSELVSLNQLFRENEQLLQRSLVQNRVKVESIVQEAVLVAKNPKQFPVQLLEMLGTQFNVRSAALYQISKQGSYDQLANTGELAKDLPNQFTQSNAPEMVKVAIENDELVTCRTLWDTETEARQIMPYIAVVPASNLLLIIQDMAFESINWDSFARVDALIQYVSSCNPDTETGSNKMTKELKVG